MPLLHKIRLNCSYSRWSSVRKIYSLTGQWDKAFDKNVMRDIERFWKSQLKQQHEKSSAALATKETSKKKFYVLSMFPYPSGKLHIGHVRVYTISDCMARYHRLTGKDVIHPMGWDAFGLPAENAAIERGVKPQDWTLSNIGSMREQLEALGCSFDWHREVATCDPDYYKWTQHIFLKLYEAGLVYQKKGAVNWDPIDQTVLADEQIDDAGRSWRSGALAERRFLKQWYIRATAYSQSLLEGLDEVNSDLWKDVIDLQRNWIGKCDGVRFDLPLMQDGARMEGESLSVFSRHPEGVFGASHILVSQQHLLNDPVYFKEQCTSSSNTDRELNVAVLNPFTGKTLPVYLSFDHDFGEYLDTHLAVPCMDGGDRDFAVSCGLDVIQVLDPVTDTLRESGQFSGMSRDEAFNAIAAYGKELGVNSHVTSEKARDWLISRQRYWGTPIPMIHCPKYGTMPVPYEDLPVTLPQMSQLSSKGSSPLASDLLWSKVKCPRCDCDGYAQRESDTMDTFVDSSWYFLRYLDAKNTQEPFSREAAHAGMPVDLYIGGKEHATMHLYYARFLQHVLHAGGLVPVREPFVNLLTQGMVMGQSYKVKATGQYIPVDQVEFSEDKKSPVTQKGTQELVVTQWEKMSKSKYNGVDPQAVLNEFGTDPTRLCILANVAPKSDRHWSNEVFVGVLRWQARIWGLVGDYIHLRQSQNSASLNEDQLQQHEADLFDMRNYYAKEVNFNMEKTFLLNTAIARLQAFTSDLRKISPEVMYTSHEYEKALAELVVMLFPFAPMFSAELWEGLRGLPHLTKSFKWEEGVWEQAWPTVHPDYRVKMKVKVDKRDVFHVRVPLPLSELVNLTQDEALKLAKSHNLFDNLIATQDVSSGRLIVIPGIRVELVFSSKKKKKAKKQKKSQQIH